MEHDSTLSVAEIGTHVHGFDARCHPVIKVLVHIEQRMKQVFKVKKVDNDGHGIALTQQLEATFVMWLWLLWCWSWRDHPGCRLCWWKCHWCQALFLSMIFWSVSVVSWIMWLVGDKWSQQLSLLLFMCLWWIVRVVFMETRCDACWGWWCWNGRIEKKRSGVDQPTTNDRRIYGTKHNRHFSRNIDTVEWITLNSFNWVCTMTKMCKGLAHSFSLGLYQSIRKERKLTNHALDGNRLKSAA